MRLPHLVDPPLACAPLPHSRALNQQSPQDPRLVYMLEAYRLAGKKLFVATNRCRWVGEAGRGSVQVLCTLCPWSDAADAVACGTTRTW